MIGKTISHYHVTGALGAGGMGEVYRATDTKLNRDVALKVLPEVFARDADRMARFKREAHVLACLNHPKPPPLVQLLRVVLPSVHEVEQFGFTSASQIGINFWACRNSALRRAQ